VSQIDALIDELCPAGVELKPLGEVGDFVRGHGIQKSDLKNQGTPAIHYGQVHTHYGIWCTYTKSFVEPELAAKRRRAQPGDLVIATTSEDDAAVAKATAWLGKEEAAVSGDAYIYRHSLDPKFVSYYFQSTHFQEQKKRYINGTKVRRISGESLAKILIPVPPLEVQQEIASILDTFTSLQAELEAELIARHRQYSHYLNSLLSFSAENARWASIGEIGRVAMCKRVFKSETAPEGDIPFYKIGTFGGKPDAFISLDLYESYKSRYSFPKTGDVLLSAAGTIGRTIPYDGAPAYFQDSNIVWIDNDESIVSNRYLYYWCQVVEWATDGGTIQRLYNGNLRRTKIAVPSFEEQERIVSILDKFDALVNDLSVGLPAELAARHKQYEYYRDRLLTFKELTA
jgi:type I restriction enzyme S subunit